VDHQVVEVLNSPEAVELPEVGPAVMADRALMFQVVGQVRKLPF
jgi:hypothetical protein